MFGLAFQRPAGDAPMGLRMLPAASSNQTRSVCSSKMIVKPTPASLPTCHSDKIEKAWQSSSADTVPFELLRICSGASKGRKPLACHQLTWTAPDAEAQGG